MFLVVALFFCVFISSYSVAASDSQGSVRVFSGENHPVKVFLQDSVSLIGADEFWVLNESSFTGNNSAVCVIDTGVDFNHSSLGGSWGEVVVGGKRFLGGDIVDCSDDNFACLDDHGHGTHVAGIVRGVAQDTKIVAVKVLDEFGWGFVNDVKKAVDYCINVSAEFNISVISLSLGAPCFDEEDNPTGLCHSDFCDEFYPDFVDLFDEAINNNISVVVATGNDGLASFISSPSCVSSAFRVASSTKSDSLSWFSNVWDKDIFLAPGSLINSTARNGGFQVRSGTSMATPHVSASLVLVSEYLNTSDSFVLREFLYNESVIVYDSLLDINFSRLNLLLDIEELEEPEEPEEPGEPEEPEELEEPEEPVVSPEQPSPRPPMRGGGGDMIVFEESSDELSVKYLAFSEVGEFFKVLEPGDVLFMGDNSLFSRFVVPKKWKHAVIYLGPEFLIRQNFGVHSEIYSSLAPYYETGNEILLLDSSSVGVSVRDVREFGFHSVVAFSPDLDRFGKQEVLSFAIGQIGKPYDFTFSKKDESFYCSELVLKSFTEVGFDLENSRLVGVKEVILPNDLVAQFSERDDFEFLFYLSKDNGLFLEKSEDELFDGPDYPVLNELRVVFFDSGFVSFVVWVLVLWFVYSRFFVDNKTKRRRRKRWFV